MQWSPSPFHPNQKRLPCIASPFALQSFEYINASRRKRCLQQQHFPHERVRNLQARSMEKHALETLAREVLAHGIHTVLVVAHNREAARGQVHPYLMRATGTKFRFHKGIAPKSLEPGNNGVRRLAFRVYLDTPLATRSKPLQ